MESSITQKLKELEKTADKFWNVSPEVGMLLYILVKTKQAKNILELGTSNGYSTIWLALAAREIKSKVTTIEYFQERIDLAIENFRYCQLDSYITVKQGKILEVLDNTNDKFDFVFIDANKSEYIEYFKRMERLLLKGGIIVADNIISHRADVEDYIQCSSSHPDFKTVLIPLDNGLLLSYKNF